MTFWVVAVKFEIVITVHRFPVNFERELATMVFRNHDIKIRNSVILFYLCGERDIILYFIDEVNLLLLLGLLLRCHPHIFSTVVSGKAVCQGSFTQLTASSIQQVLLILASPSGYHSVVCKFCY